MQRKSTHCMPQIITEQKQVFRIFESEHKLPNSLIINQSKLIENALANLVHSQELTPQMSHYEAMIPAATVLQKKESNQ